MPIIGTLLFLTAGPALLAWTFLHVFRRILPRELADRYATGMAFGLAFLIGFQIAEGFSVWIPQRHWQWLMWLVPMAGLVGGLRRAPRLHYLERTVVLAAIAVLAGWLLVPAWPDLRPSQMFWRIFLGLSFFVQSAIMERIVRRLVSHEMPPPEPLADDNFGHRALAVEQATQSSAILVGMIVSAFVVTGIVAVYVSISYCRIALVASASLIGCWAASFRSRRGVDLRQLILPFSIAVGGMAFVGCVEPRDMVWGLLIAPWAPLATGLAQFVPSSDHRSARGRRLAVAGIGFILGTAIAVSVWNMRPAPAEDALDSEATDEAFPY